MQTASQRAFKPPAKKTVRGETLKAINATWRKIAVDLEAEDLRDARLVFGTEALGLRKPLTSFSKLSPAQLGRILDAMRELERTPGLPGVRVPALAGRSAREKGPTEVGTTGVDRIVSDSDGPIVDSPGADVGLAPYELPKLVNVTLTVVA